MYIRPVRYDGSVYFVLCSGQGRALTNPRGITVCEHNNLLLKNTDGNLASAATELYGSDLYTLFNDTSEIEGRDFEFKIAGDETLYEVVNGIPQNFEYETMP